MATKVKKNMWDDGTDAGEFVCQAIWSAVRGNGRSAELTKSFIDKSNAGDGREAFTDFTVEELRSLIGALDEMQMDIDTVEFDTVADRRLMLRGFDNARTYISNAINSR